MNYTRAMSSGCSQRNHLGQKGNRKLNILASGSHQRVTGQKETGDGCGLPPWSFWVSFADGTFTFTPIESQYSRAGGLEILLSNPTFFSRRHVLSYSTIPILSYQQLFFLFNFSLFFPLSDIHSVFEREAVPVWPTYWLHLLFLVG